MAKTSQLPSPLYKGPDKLTEDMDLAMSVLGAALHVTATECDSHTHLEIGGFGSSDTLNATAVYVVGSIAQCISADLQIREALFDDATRNADLLADVEGVIGKVSVDDQFKIMNRDPWMWEAMSHLVVHLARTSSEGKILT